MKIWHFIVFVVHEMNFESSWKFLKSFCKLSKEKNKFYDFEKEDI